MTILGLNVELTQLGLKNKIKPVLKHILNCFIQTKHLKSILITSFKQTI